MNRLSRAHKAARPRTVDTAGPRPFGTMRNMIRMAPDFDEMPDDIVKAMHDTAEPNSSY